MALCDGVMRIISEVLDVDLGDEDSVEDTDSAVKDSIGPDGGVGTTNGGD